MRDWMKRNMKKIKAHCGIGFCGAEYEEDFEFDNDATEDEIGEVVNNWANQYLRVWWNYDEISETELLPCPFCGSKAEVHKTLYSEYYVDCSLSKGFCHVIPRTWTYDSEQEAIDAWNKRDGVE